MPSKSHKKIFLLALYVIVSLGLVLILGTFILLKYFDRNAVARRNVSKNPEQTYLLEQAGHSVSFLKPKGFRVDSVGASDVAINDMWLFVSAPYPPCIGTGSESWLDIRSFGSTNINFKKTPDEYAATKNIQYLGEKKMGDTNSFHVFSRKRYGVLEYVIFGNETILSLEYSPSSCTAGGKDYSSELTKILSSLSFRESAPRQHNISSQNQKINMMREDILKAIDSDQIHSRGDCVNYAEKFPSDEQFERNIVCERSF